MWEGDPIAQAAYQAIGVSPVPLSITDVMTSLQTGMIDAVYSSPYALIALQWFTRVSYAMTQPLADALGAAMISKKIFDSLPDDLKTILMANARKFIGRLTASSRQDNAKAIETLKAERDEVRPAAEGHRGRVRDHRCRSAAAPRGKAVHAGVPRRRGRGRSGAYRQEHASVPMKVIRLDRPRADGARHGRSSSAPSPSCSGWPSCRFSCGRSSIPSILWGDMAARHLVIWVGFFGAYLATPWRRGISTSSVLTRFLGPRVRLWFNVVL